VVGTFYPGDPGRTPIVVWGGSGGGQPDAEARYFADHGHPAFALRYFGAPGLPPELESIPLEYFARAVRKFDRRPGVDGRRTVVYGHSRGSESALLVGSLYPRLVHGVIATAPANKSYGAALRRGPGWTLHGKPLPVAVADDPLGGFDAPALIEVERIRGPVLLGSGAHDQLYDSKAYARAIVRRLHRRGFRYPVRSVVFPDAGHNVGEPMEPIVLRWLAGPAATPPRARTGHRARRRGRAPRRS
jgi:pimeloyl-ACP methyl ester carboxylesterase